MKKLISLLILLLIASNIYSQDICKKDCSQLKSDKKRNQCKYQIEDCYDKIEVDLIQDFEKNGISKEAKVETLKNLQQKIREYSRRINRTRLRRAMFRKLLERSKKLVILQERGF